jgi:hypothetical protein
MTTCGVHRFSVLASDGKYYAIFCVDCGVVRYTNVRPDGYGVWSEYLASPEMPRR